MIRSDGWNEYSIWEHSERVKELYARRCRKEDEEMTCAAQAADLLKGIVEEGETVLDVGCGSGYFYHSLCKRNIPAAYHGMDASSGLIAIGKKNLPDFGLPAERLKVLRIEDLAGQADHIVCMNVLTNIDNYHRPLERMLRCAKKTIILRESFTERAEYLYVKDKYLDEGCDLRVHVNSYPMGEVKAMIESYGFKAAFLEDIRSGGKPEMVIDYPHHWKFVLARREANGC